MRVRSLGREDPLEEGTAIHSIFLPGESHRQKSLAGYSPLHHTESDMTAVIQHALMQRRSVPGNADKGKTQTVVKGLGFQAWS